MSVAITRPEALKPIPGILCAIGATGARYVMPADPNGPMKCFFDGAYLTGHRVALLSPDGPVYGCVAEDLVDVLVGYVACLKSGMLEAKDVPDGERANAIMDVLVNKGVVTLARTA